MWNLHIIAIILTTSNVLAITTQTEEIRFIYPPKVRGERELFVCESNEVCSVVQRRFFQLPVVQRLCRCITGQECPWRWSTAADNRTMPLDNRSQLKFCESESLSELPECSPDLDGMNVTVRTTVEQLMARKNKTHVTLRKLVTATCRCESERYWRHNDNDHQDLNNGTTTDTAIYRCAELTKCSANEFCGFVRADTFSAYYRCSCPTHHLCLFHNRAVRNVTELLFTGPAYDAVCTLFAETDVE